MKLLSTILVFILFAYKAYSIPKVYDGVDLRTDKKVTVDLESKKYIVAYFLSSGCPCSQSHFDHLNDLQKKFKEFSFIGFHSNKSIGKDFALEYFSKFKIDFPILLDSELKFANAFQAVKTPHVFVFNGRGDMLYQGGATDSRNPNNAKHFYLQKALSQLSAGKDIETKKSKTLGCYIQR